MSFKFNPLTSQLDLVGSTSSSSGDVVGPASATDKAITRYNSTTGKLIQDSKTVLQDGGALEAQGFLTRRSITDNITIPSGESWIAPSIELELLGSIDIEENGEIIII